MKINEKPIKIGKRNKMRGYIAFECDAIPGCPGVDGWGCMCFKDEEIFWNEPDEVCYVAECEFLNSFEEDQRRWCSFNLYPQTEFASRGLTAWSKNDIIAQCKKFLKYNTYYKLDLEEFAYRVFCEATWTLPTYNDDTFGITSTFLEAAMKMKKEQDGE